MKLKIEYLPLHEIKAYPNNAKVHTEEQIEQIKKSILEFGMNDPIAVWKDNEVIEGHGRLIALTDLGYAEVPVIRLDDLTDEQRKAYMLVHNKLTMNTGFSFEILQQELDSIENYDMQAFGFDVEDSDDGDVQVEEDLYEQPEEIQPRAKRGDVYRLGEHTLMCGDSTKEADVIKLLGGDFGAVDLCVTDPPYNVSLGANKGHPLRPSEAKQLHKRQDGLVIANDSFDDKEQFMEFLRTAFNNLMAALKCGGSFYVWFSSSGTEEFYKAAKLAGMEIRQQLIWVKNTFTLGRQDYQWRHEPCLYGWKAGASHYFINSRTESTVIDDTPDFGHINKAEAVELLKQVYQSKIASSVIYDNKPSASKLHPTMKPITLIGYQIANSSKRGDVVLDLFGGSGSTLIACEQLNRKCRMMEYDPHYADVIIDRWEKFTGRQAELVEE